MREEGSVHHTVPVRQEDTIGGWRLLLAIVLCLVLATGLGLLTWAIANRLAGAWTATNDFIVLVVAEVYFAIVGALMLAFGGPVALRDRLGFRYTSARDLLLAVGVEILILLAVVLVYFLLTPVFGPPQRTAIQILRQATDVTRLSSPDPFLVGFILLRVVLLSALGEELLFRGALYGWVRRRLPATPTVLLTALLFGLAHPSVLLFPFPFLYGIGAGWVRERTGSTLNTALMHAVNDTLMLVVAYVLLEHHVL